MPYTERVSILNSNNSLLVNDYDLTAFLVRLTNGQGGIMFSDFDTKPEFELDDATGEITGGKAVAYCTRATATPIANQSFFVLFEMSGTKTGIPLTDNTKVYIEIDNDLLQDPSLIEDAPSSSDYAQGKNIGTLVAGTSRPAHSNHIKLRSKTGGVWTDHRTAPILDGERLKTNTGLRTGRSPWKLLYTDAEGNEQELPFGEGGQVLGFTANDEVPVAISPTVDISGLDDADAIIEDDYILIEQGGINVKSPALAATDNIGLIQIADDNTIEEYDNDTLALTMKQLTLYAIQFLKIVADANVLASANTERTVAAGVATPTKVKEIDIKFNGTYRITYDYARINGSGTSYAQAYKNGSTVGALRTITSGSYAGSSEDIALVAGDKIQLYISSDVIAGCKVRNFRVGGIIALQTAPTIATEVITD